MFKAVTFTSRRLAVALCMIAVVVAVGACGSSASTSSSSAAAAGGGSGLSGGSTTARLDLAKCFRGQGINVSDSGSTTGGGGGGVFSAFRNYPRAKVEAAMKTCSKYMSAAFPAATLTPAQRAQRTQALVKYATCMRSHGVNIPDPTTSGGGPGGGGFAFGAGGAGGGSVRSLINTPAYKTANMACASLRPKFGGGAGVGTGAAGA